MSPSCIKEFGNYVKVDQSQPKSPSLKSKQLCNRYELWVCSPLGFKADLKVLQYREIQRFELKM